MRSFAILAASLALASPAAADPRVIGLWESPTEPFMMRVSADGTYRRHQLISSSGRWTVLRVEGNSVTLRLEGELDEAYRIRGTNQRPMVLDVTFMFRGADTYIGPFLVRRAEP